MVAALLQSLFEFIGQLTWERFFRTFWYYLVLDFPRYILFDFVVVFLIFKQRLRAAVSRRQALFDHQLQNHPPLVSVIVPALNEAATIPYTIQTLLEQSYKNLEIILVDDGSDDHTARIVQVFDPARVKYFRLAVRSGKAAALNFGLRRARGEFIVFIDSDSTLERDAVYEVLRPFSHPKVGAVAGNLNPRNAGDNLLTTLQTVEYLFTITVGRLVRARANILSIISGAFGAFRRSAIDLDFIGGQEPGPGNDSDITIRVRKVGYRIEFVPEAICRTDVPIRLLPFFRQRWRWDRNLIKNRLRKHRDVFNIFAHHFNLYNFFSFLDLIFFHCVLAVLAPLYIIDILANYRRDALIIFLMNYFIYTFSSMLELTAASYITRRWSYMQFIPYLFIYNFYHKMMKFSRLFGYVQELFFFYSYHDPFAPKKVRERILRW
ncbi:MAG: glycosyltransferase [bacterium]